MIFNNCPHCSISSSLVASRWESGALSQSALAAPLSSPLAQNVWSVSSAQSFGRRACSKAHGKGKAKIKWRIGQSEREVKKPHRLSIGDNSELITLVIATKNKNRREKWRGVCVFVFIFNSLFTLWSSTQFKWNKQSKPHKLKRSNNAKRSCRQFVTYHRTVNKKKTKHEKKHKQLLPQTVRANTHTHTVSIIIISTSIRWCRLWNVLIANVNKT